MGLKRLLFLENNKQFKIGLVGSNMGEKEMSEKEKKVRSLTRIYYSNPRVQEALLSFAKDREVVPRYFEKFGKRPDILQYPSDIVELVKKGATSFHASEELWGDPLQLSPDSTLKELENLRKGWDLLIDIDSPFLDCSKIALKLIVRALERHGVKNYGIKFSGSKGFHIIVSGKAFPKEMNGEEMRKMFPTWPRAICAYLNNEIKAEYNREVNKMGIDFEALERRTKLKKEDVEEAICPRCSRAGKKGKLTKFVCDSCGSSIERKNVKLTKRRLRCLNNGCAGILRVVEEKDFFLCEYCGTSSWDKLEGFGDRGRVVHSAGKEDVVDFERGISGEKIAGMDLVLVSPRHLFRMPYSLHEKTALASVVLTKGEIEDFSPKNASPLNVEIKDFMPYNESNEALRLLARALDWQKARKIKEKEIEEKRFSKYKDKKFEDVELKGVTDEMFPAPIKKLLKGLNEGRKRGLFVLLTFLRSVGFSAEEINKRVREWNEKNEPPLKEGYVRSQIEWHLKQTKKILPPNYSNDAFYKDIGILEKKPETKNPLVDVKRNLWKKTRSESF